MCRDVAERTHAVFETGTDFSVRIRCACPVHFPRRQGSGRFCVLSSGQKAEHPDRHRLHPAMTEKIKHSDLLFWNPITIPSCWKRPVSPASEAADPQHPRPSVQRRQRPCAGQGAERPGRNRLSGPFEPRKQCPAACDGHRVGYIDRLRLKSQNRYRSAPGCAV